MATDPEKLRQVQLNAAAFDRLIRLTRLIHGDQRKVIEALFGSQSQIGQDLFVLGELGWKREGTFVEFGATNGRSLSNTWALEKGFGWKGILAEPARCWHEALKSSGRSATIVTDCVWTETGRTIRFRETENPEISTIDAYRASDNYDRDAALEYDVQTVSLTDLLARHGAPAVVDYLSIDTEGSEFDILSAFDFSRYRFRVITCEHNYTPNREKIHALLTAKGYVRKFEQLSEYDDWYVLTD